LLGSEQEMSFTGIGIHPISKKRDAMRLNNSPFFRLLVIAVLTMCNTMSVAQVDDGISQGEEVFRKECSSCHMAYPPRMLPGKSWRIIMAGLDKHFGSDASLPDGEIKQITAFLLEHSVESWGDEQEPLWITRTRWFMRRHVYIVPPDMWENDAVKSPANCPACHKKAEQGDYSERNTSMPE